MTREEAIKIIKATKMCLEKEANGIDDDCNFHNCDDCNLCYEQGNSIEKQKAYQMAIKALEQQKTGQWEDISNGIEYDWGTCNKCKARIPMTYKYYEFCPHCGAKMVESEET